MFNHLRRISIWVAMATLLIVAAGAVWAGDAAAQGSDIDYDADDDGLIEVANLAQLSAIRWDLDGDGAADHAGDSAGYSAAFLNALTGMGCPSDGCDGYELTVDLDFDTNGDGRTDIAGDDYWNDGEGWDHIGSLATAFNGNGHTIDNLYINRENAYAAALIRKIRDNAKVQNIGLTNVNVTGDDCTGSLVGSNEGSVSNAFATGAVNGSLMAGGLAGCNSGQIDSSYTWVDVWVDSSYSGLSVGGLVGYNHNSHAPSITNSYATGKVGGSKEYNGGLVGLIIGKSGATNITDSFSFAAADGEHLNIGLLGGIYGTSRHPICADNFWDSQRGGQESGLCGMGKTTSELTAPTSASGIYASWDATKWDFGTAVQYPALKVDFDGDGDATWQEFGNQRADHDTDDDGLIEVANLAQLNAIRWDLDGDGAADHAGDSAGYSAAFLNALTGMGCNEDEVDSEDQVCVGYELTTDLDFDTNGDGQADIAGDDYWNGGKGWEPIGYGLDINYIYNRYQATFEGNGHVVKNLFIHRKGTTNYTGLFAYTGASGAIRNVGVVDAQVTGSFWVGTLAGGNEADVENAYATGRVSGKLGVGGLFGGAQYAEIKASYADVVVKGTSSQVGGLTGAALESTNIISSYAAGPVEGVSLVGGLAGFNQGGINDSYASGLVSGNNLVGGLIGYNNGGSANRSYSTGKVSASSRFGGLIGDSKGGSFASSYWDTDTSGQSASVGGAGKTTDELQTPAGNTGIYSAWGSDHWDYGAATQYPALKVDFNRDGLATWQEFGVQRPDYDADDDGLIDVSNLAQLNALRWDLDGDGVADDVDDRPSYRAAFLNAVSGLGCPSDGCAGYELTTDLDFDTNGDGRTDISGDDYWNDGKGWYTIGYDEAPSSNYLNKDVTFRAVFEGNGHVIKNLFINQTGRAYVGLFGYVYRPAVIRNIGLENAQVRGGYYVGALVGALEARVESSHATGSVYASLEGAGGLVGGARNATITHSHANVAAGSPGPLSGGLVSRADYSDITHSYATGPVDGGYTTGGLAGYLSGGRIDSSYATGSVHGSLPVGGLVGRISHSTVTDSYATGNVSGREAIGGLVGDNNWANVLRSYSTGKVAGRTYVGGLVGQDDNGSVTASYWDTDTSGQSASDGGVGKTTVELQAPTGKTGVYADWSADLWDFGTATQRPALKVDLDGNGTPTWQEFGPQRADYDADSDGLLEISTLSQLNAIRWDPNGDGVVADGDFVNYRTAFSNAILDMGCPDHGCVGYELIADLNLDTNHNRRADSSDAYWNDGAGWEPIGSYSTILEGNGHAIARLHINRVGAEPVGLFGQLTSGAEVRNLALTNVDITSGGDAGAFAGRMVTSGIRGSYATGSVSGGGDNASVGGLAGKASGHPSRQDTFRDTYSLVNVASVGTGSRVGGLVGALSASGSSQPWIANSFAAGPVHSTAPATAGGLVGESETDFTWISNSYWDRQTSGWDTSAVGSRQTQKRLQSNRGIFHRWSSSVWDFGSSSQYPALKYDTDGDGAATAAEFGHQPRAATIPAVDLDADNDGLIEVSNKAQLNAIRWDLDGDGSPSSNGDDYWDAFNGGNEAAAPCVGVPCHGYELTDHINLDSQPWAPIGNDSDYWNATFRGNGHTISHLFIHSDDTTDNYGLFGETSSDSVIEGVYIYSPDVVSYGGNPDDNEHNNAGALVGMNRGIVRESGMSYVWGDICRISALVAAGGLVGGNKGIVERSWARCGDVKSNRAGGGLVGFNHSGATVRDSWADGLVIVNPGGGKKGALVGRNFGTIRRAFSLGETRRNGSTNHGPLTGQQEGAVAQGFYVGSYDQREFGGINRTDVQMRAPDASDLSFFAHWPLDLWDLGDDEQYSALRVDANGDGYSTLWEIGSQRPSDHFEHKPVFVDGNAAHSIWKEGLSLRFRKADGDANTRVDGVGYRIAQKGEACHEWFGGSVVMLGETNGRATLTEDDGVYTLVLDRGGAWAFRPNGRVCIDVGFINTEGQGSPGRRYHDIHMPAGGAPESKPIKAAEAIIDDGSVALWFETNPYDRVRGVGYRVAREGNACEDWTGGSGVFHPGDEIDGATLTQVGGLWRLGLPVGEEHIMEPHHRYCVDVTAFNDYGEAGTGRRWEFITGN